MVHRRVGVFALVAAMTAAMFGCAPAEDPGPALEPRISPPAIAEEGVLRVGVDFDHPPYAGVDQDREAGIDIDVASALAAELGLVVEFVEIPADQAASALAAGDADVVMSTPFTEAAIGETSFAGWYVETGAALFSSAEETQTARAVGRQGTAVQEGSQAYWDLTFDFGEDELFVVDTLREAFEALEEGEVSVAAGDALTGAYLLRDFPSLGYAGLIGPVIPIGIAVPADSPELEAAVRSALDDLAASGVLDTIRAKWVDGLPELDADQS